MNLVMLGGQHNEAIEVVTRLFNMRQDGLDTLILLQHYGIKGADIWRLYKDCCEEDIDKLVRVMGALRMGGIVTIGSIKRWIAGEVELDLEAIVEDVK